MRALLLFVAVLGPSAFAMAEDAARVASIRIHADGVMPIDQALALAGGITPADTPGFPITLSQPGSYRLSGNLTVPDANTTAIRIAADFVSLDLNGFTISGPVVCATSSPTGCPPAGTGIGVQASFDSAGAAPGRPFARGVRVFNGTIRGMGLYGVQLSGEGTVVEKVTAHGNAGGGILAGAVFQSTAIGNGSFGIVAGTVRDSTSTSNAGDGIIAGVAGGPGGVVIANLVSSNGGFGIALQPGTATSNTVFGNGQAGISALCPSSVIGNTIIATGAAAIEANGAGCVLANNATRP